MHTELPLYLQLAQAHSRRQFLKASPTGLGAFALAMLLEREGRGGQPPRPGEAGGALARQSPGPAVPTSALSPMARKPPHFAPRAKRVIYLHMSGGPPQQDLFDWKPELVKHHMQPCPDELLKNQRFAFIKGHPKLLGTPYKFARSGQCGAMVSELLPHLRGVVDEIAIVQSMYTDQFNHAPAELFLYTGSARNGGAAMGSWITYGLGTENQDLPGFIVLISGGTDPTGGKALWSTGFLPSVYQGVQCRTVGDPVLYVNDPRGMNRGDRRRTLDALRKLNEYELSEFGDPETLTRISQYELAFRMQMSVPDAMDIRQEPARISGGIWGQSRRVVVCQQLPAGAAAARARSALRPAFRLGLGLSWDRQWRRHRQASAAEVQGGRPADRGFGSRFEEARAARRNPGRLGRGIRPDVDERGAGRVDFPGP